MDLNNITDIEVLRNALKQHMIKVKKDFCSEDGTGYLFKKDHWYNYDYDDYDDELYVYSESGETFTFKPSNSAEEYLYVDNHTDEQEKLISAWLKMKEALNKIGYNLDHSAEIELVNRAVRKELNINYL